MYIHRHYATDGVCPASWKVSTKAGNVWLQGKQVSLLFELCSLVTLNCNSKRVNVYVTVVELNSCNLYMLCSI